MSYNHHKSNYGEKSNRQHQHHVPRLEHFDNLAFQPSPSFQPRNFQPPPPFVHQQYPPLLNPQPDNLFLPQLSNYQQQPFIPPELNTSINLHCNNYPTQSYTSLPINHLHTVSTSESLNQRLKPIDSNQTATDALKRLQLPPNHITETGIITNTPYYELPAGLMIPLVKTDQKEYKPLNPKDLRLPLPKVPDENFLRSIDSYYSDDAKARDNDGWDRKRKI